VTQQLSKGEDVPGFFVQGGLLFRDSPIDGTQLCVPEGEALNKLLFAAHDANAHVGIDKTVSALKAFYIPGGRHTVSRYVGGCSTCMRSKHENRKQQGLLMPMPVPEEPWQRISIDVVGGFPNCRGFDCILVMVDYFSKEIRAAPMPGKYDAEMVADMIIVIQYTGPPRSIHSDRGPAFTSELFHRIFEMWGTDITHTTAYHPEGDGNTEIYNKHLVQALRATLADGAGDADWVDILPFMVWSLNSTVYAVAVSSELWSATEAATRCAQPV